MHACVYRCVQSLTLGACAQGLRYLVCVCVCVSRGWLATLTQVIDVTFSKHTICCRALCTLVLSFQLLFVQCTLCECCYYTVVHVCPLFITFTHSSPSSLTSDQILQPSSGSSHQSPPTSSLSSHPPPRLTVTTSSQSLRPTATSTSTSRNGSRSHLGRQASGSTTAASAHVGAPIQGRGGSGGGVTGDALQQALANAFSSIQTPSRAAQAQVGI